MTDTLTQELQETQAQTEEVGANASTLETLQRMVSDLHTQMTAILPRVERHGRQLGEIQAANKKGSQSTRSITDQDQSTDYDRKLARIEALLEIKSAPKAVADQLLATFERTGNPDIVREVAKVHAHYAELSASASQSGAAMPQIPGKAAMPAPHQASRHPETIAEYTAIVRGAKAGDLKMIAIKRALDESMLIDGGFDPAKLR